MGRCADTCPGRIGGGRGTDHSRRRWLCRFLEADVLPSFETRKKELANRPLIREQAFGEALTPDKLEPLGRDEVHLDRKLERMLAMLVRLQDLRRGPMLVGVSCTLLPGA